MSSDKYSAGKSSRGILKTRTRDDWLQDDNKEHQRIRIFVQNPDNDDDALSVGSENEFEKLKELYYKRCRPINESLVKKYESQGGSEVLNFDEIKCTSVRSHPHDQDRSRSHRESSKEPESQCSHHCHRLQ